MDILHVLKTVPDVKFEMASRDAIIKHFKITNSIVAVTDNASMASDPDSACCGVHACHGPCSEE